MKSTEAFLNEWNNNSKIIDSDKSGNTRGFSNLMVQLSKSASDDYTMRINYIKSTKRKKGELKKFMTWITNLADKNELTLIMAAQPFGRYDEDKPNKHKLKEITERYGFELKYEYPDELGYEMARSHHPVDWEW